jgi:hypothetical protein
VRWFLFFSFMLACWASANIVSTIQRRCRAKLRSKRISPAIARTVSLQVEYTTEIPVSSSAEDSFYYMANTQMDQQRAKPEPIVVLRIPLKRD